MRERAETDETACQNRRAGIERAVATHTNTIALSPLQKGGPNHA